VHVIEHVTDPVSYLREILKLTKPGGKLVVITPNLNDVLMNVDREKTAPFFYRKVHNYYFTVESLRWVAEMAGWRHESEIFYHEFGLSNALIWLRDGKPGGHKRLGTITEGADAWWKGYLESTKQSNNVGVVLSKPATEKKDF
jgi:SAM-dependent methyltransferase